MPPERVAAAPLRVDLVPSEDTSGPFHLVAKRRGEMWLHEMGDGSLLVSAGPMLLEATSGVSMTVHPERLRGLEPPGSDESRWTVHAVGGFWPDAAYMTLTHDYVMCAEPLRAAYRWQGSAWARLPNRDGDLEFDYDHFVAYGEDSVLTRRRYSAGGRFRDLCDDELPPRVATALKSKTPQPFRIWTDSVETRGPAAAGDARMSFASTTTGDIYAIETGALWHWSPGTDRQQWVAPPDACPGFVSGMRVRGPADIYVWCDGRGDPPRPTQLLHFDGHAFDDAWELEDSYVQDVLRQRDGTVWVISEAARPAELGFVPYRLLRYDGDTWQEQHLPTLFFPQGPPRWGYDQPALVADLPPWSLAVDAEDRLWVLAYAAYNGDGLSAVFHTEPVAEILDVPGYDEIRRLALRQAGAD